MVILHSPAVQSVTRHLVRVALVGILATTGCQTMKQDKEEPPAEEQEEEASMKVPVGSIHMVHPDGQFVLIKSSRFLQIEPGTELTTYDISGVPTGRLLVSPARKGVFMTADIIEGAPEAGNHTLMDYTPRQPTQATPGPAEGGPPPEDEIQVLE